MILCPVSVPGATSGWLEGETFRGSGAKGLWAGDILLKAISIHAKGPLSIRGPRECDTCCYVNIRNALSFEFIFIIAPML